MDPRKRHWWVWVKFLLALLILGAVGWRFWDILQPDSELWQQPLQFRVEWLLVTAGIYVVGLAFWGGYWHWLLHRLGESVPRAATYRAYYMGHVAKYVPGKAMSLLLRTGLLYDAGVRPAVGALSATYETLTTMATGALLAALLFLTLAIDPSVTWWVVVLLLALAGIPILPGVFNLVLRTLTFLANRASRRFQLSSDMAPLPRVKHTTLLGGLLITGCGWWLMGLSLWALLQAILPEPPPLTLSLWARLTAYVAFACVAGFLAVVVPGGLGVRELFLQPLLARELSQHSGLGHAVSLAVVLVLVLRLLWIVSEVIMAAIVYWLPVTGSVPADSEDELAAPAPAIDHTAELQPTDHGPAK